VVRRASIGRAFGPSVGGFPRAGRAQPQTGGGLCTLATWGLPSGVRRCALPGIAAHGREVRAQAQVSLAARRAGVPGSWR
jgi:hypothetical protein